MIFVTVGAQMPFDRLVSAIDKWAGANPEVAVFAQVGDTSLSLQNVEWSKRLSSSDFKRKMREASLVVAHAGMGSILTALEFNTPILVLPRSGRLRETRNDHQIATASWLAEQGRVAVALDEAELLAKLDDLDSLTTPGRIGKWASGSLIAAVQEFVLSS